MGNIQAYAFAAAVEQDQVSLYLALYHHFAFNHFPRVPVAAIEPAEKAIEQANLGEWDELIDISDVGKHRVHGSEVPVNVLIDEWHLSPFVNNDEEF